MFIHKLFTIWVLTNAPIFDILIKDRGGMGKPHGMPCFFYR